MLCLLLNKHLQLVLEVKYLQEIPLDLLGLIQCLLHPLRVNPTTLVLPSHVLRLSQLRSDLRDLDLPLTRHLPRILQTRILRSQGLLEFTQGLVTVLQQGELVRGLVKFLLKGRLIGLGGVELILQVGELVFLLEEGLVFLFDVSLELGDLLLQFL